MSAQNPQNLDDLIQRKKAISTVAQLLTEQVGPDVEASFQGAIDAAASANDARIVDLVPDTPGSVPAPILSGGTLYVGFVDASGKRTYAELPAAIDAATIPIPAASGGVTPPDGSGGTPTPPATVTIPVLPPGQTTPPDSGTAPATPPADTVPPVPAPATNPDGSPAVDPNAPPATNPDGSPVLPPPVPVPNP